MLNGSANVNSEEHDKQPTDLIYGTCEKDSLEAEMKVKMENVDELEQHDFTNLDERQTNIGMKNEIEPQTVSNEFDQNLGLYYRDNYVNPNNYMYCLVSEWLGKFKLLICPHPLRAMTIPYITNIPMAHNQTFPMPNRLVIRTTCALIKANRIRMIVVK